MQITVLGHAGFCVETKESIVIMDPWLSKSGAYEASWFQYPKNHHMGDYVQQLLSTSHKNKYIYISHEHKDHFDIDFLQSLKSRDFTILLADFSYPLVHNILHEQHYRCKEIVLLKDQQHYALTDGSIVLFIIDTELNCDSAILLRSESQSFLNINDCKIHDKLDFIVKKYGKIDVFTAQFSGASWYPTCYQMPDDVYQAECIQKIHNKFQAILDAINAVNPKIYLPSAGPPCFLDPKLFHINFQAINSYPRAPQLITYLNQHGKALKRKTHWTEIFPGDALDVNTLSVNRQASSAALDKNFRAYVESYAKEYEEWFEKRKEDHDKINPQEVFVRLKTALEEKLNALTSVNETVHTLLYWRIKECPSDMYCVDLAHKTIEKTSKIADLTDYVRITAPAWLVNKVLNKELSWPDFALTFQMTLEREPNVYNTLLHGFLILDTEKMHSFCLKLDLVSNRRERIIIEHDGKRYSVLRYCPHQGADLSQSHFEGCMLVCPRHQLHFNLKNHGKCETNELSIDAIDIDNK